MTQSRPSCETMRHERPRTNISLRRLLSMNASVSTSKDRTTVGTDSELTSHASNAFASVIACVFAPELWARQRQLAVDSDHRPRVAHRLFQRVPVSGFAKPHRLCTRLRLDARAASKFSSMIGNSGNWGNRFLSLYRESSVGHRPWAALPPRAAASCPNIPAPAHHHDRPGCRHDGLCRRHGGAAPVGSAGQGGGDPGLSERGRGTWRTASRRDRSSSWRADSGGRSMSEQKFFATWTSNCRSSARVDIRGHSFQGLLFHRRI